MRKALVLSLLAIVLGGCASEPARRDISGVWINQAAIDAAANGGNLREALLAYGPNLEWDIDVKNATAHYTNGFESVEGKLLPADDGMWQVSFYGSSSTDLSLEGETLVQAETDAEPRQPFVRSQVKVASDAPLGTSFETALNAAYLGGQWRVVSGAGKGNQVTFSADGQVTGLPNTQNYVLCLAGDCASMSGGYDSIWLQLNGQGNPWIFARKGGQLEIFQAINTARADEVPQFTPGPRQWLLEK